MKYVEMAYILEDIRKVTIPDTTNYHKLHLNNKFVYLYNDSVSQITVFSQDTIDSETWGNLVATTCGYPIPPRGTLGPIMMDNLYIKTNIAGSSLIILVQRDN